MVFEPIATGLGGNKKARRAKSIDTQRKLRASGKSPKERDEILLSKINAMGLNVK